MDSLRRVEIVDRRYRQRKDAGASGWAREDSYGPKITTVDRLVASYAVPKGGRFLELGCGAGNVTLHAARSGLDSYGIDMSSTAIEWAAEQARQQGVRANFRQESVVTLDSYADSHFDLVFDGDCLWMVLGDDRARCFANVYRTLKPGGVFFAQAHLLSDQAKDRYDIAPGVCFDPHERVTTVQGVPMYQYSYEDDFIAELGAAGFVTLRRERIRLGDKEGDAPFAAGSLCVDAQKPLAVNDHPIDRGRG